MHNLRDHIELLTDDRVFQFYSNKLYFRRAVAWIGSNSPNELESVMNILLERPAYILDSMSVNLFVLHMPLNRIGIPILSLNRTSVDYVSFC